MAILIEKAGEKSYKPYGTVTEDEKETADRLSKELKTAIADLEKSWVRRGLITNKGHKKDALRIWFELGQELNSIADKYRIKGTTDEPWFWYSIYNYVSPLIHKGRIPKRVKGGKWKRDHFRLCAMLATWSWKEVRDVGNWSIWRDLFDNFKIQEDSWVFKRVVTEIRKCRSNYNLGHKQLRPLIHNVRRRISNLRLDLLSADELGEKLEPIFKGFEESLGKK